MNVDYQSELPELGGSNCSMLAAIPVLVITNTKLIWTDDCSIEPNLAIKITCLIITTVAVRITLILFLNHNNPNSMVWSFFSYSCCR